MSQPSPGGLLTHGHRPLHRLSLSGKGRAAARPQFAYSESGERLSRLGNWALDRMRPVPEFDQLADDLAKASRRERLLDNIRRLRRLVATDERMSATRQLGNRLALAQLLQELAELRDTWEAFPYSQGIDRWYDDRPDPLRSATAGGYPRNVPTVEVLDIGWRD